MWPTLADFSGAVQNPASAFVDAELKQGLLETSKLGLPRARAGNFAVVFRVICPSNSWAVRCFVSEQTDHEERYEAIDRELRKLALPFTVGFQFQREGIRVNNRLYPMLKMEWVQGETLSTYIRNHLDQPQQLASLAQEWLSLVKRLREAGVAHGDLSDANILVADGHLRLVDYDGMFVPALAGRPGREGGRPSFQPPWRRVEDFDPNLDYFSAWSIFISLYALAVDPSLWSTLKGGDDCLLFRRQDYLSPSSSDAFRVLEQTKDGPLLAMISSLQTIIVAGDRQAMPPVDVWATSQGAVDELKTNARAARWWEGKPQADAAPPAGPESTDASASWLTERLYPSEAKEKTPDKRLVGRDRSVLAAGVCVLAAILSFAALIPPLWGWLALTTIGMVLAIYVKLRSGSRSEVQAKVRATQQLRLVSGDMRSLDKKLAAADRELSAVDARHQAALKALETRLEASTQNLRSRVDAVRDRESGARSALQQRRTSVMQNRAKAEEDALRSLQRAYVDGCLRRHSVSLMRVPGVGDERKKALQRNGIATAADLSYSRVRRVYGFGQALTAAVMSWRNGLERQAASGIPKTVPQAERDLIRKRYDAELSAVVTQLENEVKMAADVKTSAEKQLADAQQSAENERRKLQEVHRRERQTALDKVARLQKDRHSLLWTQARAQHQVRQYEHVGLLAFTRRVFRGW